MQARKRHQSLSCLESEEFTQSIQLLCLPVTLLVAIPSAYYHADGFTTHSFEDSCQAMLIHYCFYSELLSIASNYAPHAGRPWSSHLQGHWNSQAIDPPRAAKYAYYFCIPHKTPRSSISYTRISYTTEEKLAISSPRCQSYSHLQPVAPSCNLCKIPNTVIFPQKAAA